MTKAHTDDRVSSVAGGLALLWAVSALAIGSRGFASVNDDARLLLFVSVVTPTYFAAWLNLVALVVGVVLLIRRPLRTPPPVAGVEQVRSVSFRV